MDTLHLIAFAAVAEYQSFSAAAERLHLTQPAISKRIAVLEHQLGCKLFDRIGHKVSLTTAGLELLPRAQYIIRQVSDAQRYIKDLSGRIWGKLSIATSHHIGLHHLPKILREFSLKYPQVNMQLSFLDSESAYNAILQGKHDLAIITLSPTKEKMITSHAIWEDTLQFVTSPEYALQQQQTISLKDLSQFPAILPGLNTYTTQAVKKHFDRQRLPLHLTMSTNYLETIKMMTSIGMGWSALPETMIDSQLAPLSVGNIKISRKLGCIYHQSRDLSNAAKAFLRLLNLAPENCNLPVDALE